MTKYTLLFSVIFCLFAVSCGQQNTSSNALTADISQDVQDGPWSQSTVDDFYQNCMTSSSKNQKIDSEAYCSCLLDLMKDRYRPGEATKAVKENATEATSCLRSALQPK